MLNLNPRSHLSILTMMALMGTDLNPLGIHPHHHHCQRFKKSDKLKRRRMKLARRKQRKMN